MGLVLLIPDVAKHPQLKLIFIHPLVHILGTYPVSPLCTFPGPAILLRIATLPPYTYGHMFFLGL